MTDATDESEMMIEADGLTRHYGKLAAVRDVSFRVPRGQVTAFLGPNGAGKSTTMKMLTGFIAPTRGRALIGGIDPAVDRPGATARLGYLPENGPLYPDMTPRGLLEFFGAARGLTARALAGRIDAVVEQCVLAEVAHKPIGKLSRGYRQRVGMANAILHEPDVLILDEPTAGLDPNQIGQVRQLIRTLSRDEGRRRTVLLSTHILQEVEAIADRVIFIHDGRLAFDGDLDAFRAAAPDGNLDARFAELTGHVANHVSSPSPGSASHPV
ncbi:MAG: ABC transporter ATP-binding protein [Phycisphaerales bacterium]